MKTLVMTYGRFSIPTIGHKAHIQATKDFAKQHNAEYKIFVSSKQDKNNPLPVSTRIQLLEQVVPDTTFIPHDSPFAVLEQIHKGYDTIIIATGGDYDNSHTLINAMTEYARNRGVNLQHLSTGQRQHGVNGTAIRTSIANKDYETFSRLYGSADHSKDVYEQMINNNSTLDGV